MTSLRVKWKMTSPRVRRNMMFTEKGINIKSPGGEEKYYTQGEEEYDVTRGGGYVLTRSRMMHDVYRSKKI